MSTAPTAPAPWRERGIPEGSTLDPSRGGYARHVRSLAKRSLIKTWRTPEALIDVTLQPVVFLALFTYIFGGAIGGSSHDYLQFLLPGLLAQSIAMASVSLGQNLNADIHKGVFDRFRSLPIGRSVPLVGAVTADIGRYFTLCAATLAFGTVMGFRFQTSPLAAAAGVGVAIAFALCFCWISVLVGMKARTPGAVQGIMFMIVLPLSFASNTYVNPGTMPDWLRMIVVVNPISQLVSTMRGLMIGGPVANSLMWTLIWMAALLIVFVPLALRAYRRRA
jgi:oleandomycin transport system permease protein